MTYVVTCLDGLSPTYLSQIETPGWDAIATAGTSGIAEGTVPSVTNVNNVSLVTGQPPIAHGITGNTYYDRETDERVYMRDASLLRGRTHLEVASDDGAKTGVLVVKEKLRRMVGRGCSLSASAEDPPAWLEDAVGPAPDIYSGDASEWVLSAAVHVLDERDLDVLYVSTTDVVPHKHGPEEQRAKAWVRALDDGLAAIHERADEIAVTADHGMREKTTSLDLEAVLAREEEEAEVIRLIRDRHTYHHQNLGGAAYVYLTQSADLSWLATVDGVDTVVPRSEFDQYGLPQDRTGDVLVLGDPETVFGPVDGDGIRESVSLRSHGSHHEQTVPYALTVDQPIDRSYELFDALTGGQA